MMEALPKKYNIPQKNNSGKYTNSISLVDFSTGLFSAGYSKQVKLNLQNSFICKDRDLKSTILKSDENRNVDTQFNNFCENIDMNTRSKISIGKELEYSENFNKMKTTSEKVFSDNEKSIFSENINSFKDLLNSIDWKLRNFKNPIQL